MAFTIDLQGKVAVVTGASSGIGLGVVQMLCESGATVAGCARHVSKEWINLQQEEQSKGKTMLFLETDVKSTSSLQNFVDRTVAAFGRIDILVSNAGANVFEGVTNCSEGQWQENIDLNLKSHWTISKLCYPYLSKNFDGTIIIMSSNHAYATIPGCFPYNVTKSALIGLVRSLAIEWGPLVRVSGLAPGFIDTPGNDNWFRSFPDPEAERNQTIVLHPAGKLGTVEQIGAFCVFLASQYASFATGSTYIVDGGRTALLQD